MNRRYPPYYLRGNYNGVSKRLIQTIISTQTYLPMCRSLYPAINGLTNPLEVSSDNIRDLIITNPSLTHSLLNIYHSSAYPDRTKITGINKLISEIGNDLIIPIILSAFNDTESSIISDTIENYLQEHLFHSLKCAYLALLISKEISYKHPFDAYVSGLLHDIGKLALVRKYPNTYSKLLKVDFSDGINLAEEEIRLVGADHCMVGASMVEDWDTLPFLSDSIFYHHYPIDRLKQASVLTRLIFLADMTINGKSTGNGSYIEAGKELLGLNENQLVEFVSIAEFKATNKLSGLGVEIDLNNRPVDSIIFSGKSTESTNRYINNDYVIKALLDIIRASNQKEDIFRNLKRAIQVLTGIGDVLFYLYDSNRKRIKGFFQDQNFSLIELDDLSIPEDAINSLIAISLTMGIDINSFDYSSQNVPALIDAQVTKYLGREGIYCLPVFDADQSVGVIVIGVNEADSMLIKEKIRLLRQLINHISSMLSENENSKNAASVTLNDEENGDSIKVRKIVHEINNPLSAIKNYLKVLNMKLSDLNEDNSEIRIINDEIDRISKLLKELPKTSKNKLNKKELTNINNVISDLITLSKNSYIDGTDVKIQFDYDNLIPEIIIEKDALRQIILNLIKNSIEAMPEGGNILLRTRYVSDSSSNGTGENIFIKNKKIEISVMDDGPGLPDNIRSGLFKEVSSTKQGHDGLGLSIVNDLVARLGGSITLDDQIKEGTCFRIYLPVIIGKDNHSIFSNIRKRSYE